MPYNFDTDSCHTGVTAEALRETIDNKMLSYRRETALQGAL